MITVAIAEVFYFVEFNPLSDYTGGENGLPGVPTPSLNLGFTTIHFNTDWSLYGFMAFWYFLGIVIALAHRALAGRCDPERDPRQSAACRRRRPQHSRLQAHRLRHRGGLCRLRRRPARRAAGLHAAGCVHVRNLGPARHADGDRRRRHAVRPAGWRRRLAVSCSDFFQTTLHLGATWKLVLGVVFVLLVCFLRRGIIGGLRDLLGTVARRRRALAPRGSAGAGRGRSTWPASVLAPPQREAVLRSGARGARADEDIRRSRRQQGHQFLRQAGRAARHYRPERRRQEHVLQDADLRDAADVRTHPVSWPRHHRHGCRQGLPARPDQELSGQPALHSTDPARQHRHRRTG